jgi:hypothetical protein
LEQCLQQARGRVQALKEQVESDPGQDSRRAQAARERAEREREQRLEHALARLPEIEQTKRRNGGKSDEARASSTDAEARIRWPMAVSVWRTTPAGQRLKRRSSSAWRWSWPAPTWRSLSRWSIRCSSAGRLPGQWLVDGGYLA